MAAKSKVDLLKSGSKERTRERKNRMMESNSQVAYMGGMKTARHTVSRVKTESKKVSIYGKVSPSFGGPGGPEDKRRMSESDDDGIDREGEETMHQSAYPPVVLPFCEAKEPEEDVEEEEIVIRTGKASSKVVIGEEEDDEDDDAALEPSPSPSPPPSDTKTEDAKPSIGIGEQLSRLSSDPDSSQLLFFQLPASLPIPLPKPSTAAPASTPSQIKTEDAGNGQVKVKVEPPVDEKVGGENAQEASLQALRAYEARQKRLYEEQLRTFQSRSEDSITDIPPGQLGTLQILRSGKVRLKLGGVALQVMEGAQCNFHQQLLSIDVDKKQAMELGSVKTRLVCSMDVDDLLSDFQPFSSTK